MYDEKTENQSCRQANEKSKPFAAVIYGKGFKAANTVQVVEGLSEIEDRLGSSGIWYFGDLDPAGLDIPRKIKASRSLPLSTLNRWRVSGGPRRG